MKLYSANLSPFSSRVRLAIYAKGLPVAIEPAFAGPKSADYLALNPMGKAPCLVTDSGEAIPESAVILEYLEEAYPEPALLPRSPEQRARARLLGRINELYVEAAAGPLFRQMDPASRDQAAVDAAMSKMGEGLGWLEHYLGEGPFAIGDGFSLADCMLAPNQFYLGVMAQVFGRPDLITARAKLARYREQLATHPAVAKVWGEMGQAMKTFQETGQIS